MQNSTVKLNIIFMGSSPISVELLDYLHKHKNISVKYVVTKKDKKVGRGQVKKQNIVAKYANKNNIPVKKVTSLLKNPNQLPKSTFTNIDYVVVFSFGFILPSDILCHLPNRFINLHTSLLPKCRGASPIYHALINGDLLTGNTVMVMDKGMDTGPILAKNNVKIQNSDTYTTLSKKLVDSGKKLLVQALFDYKHKKVKPTTQPKKGVSLALPIQKKAGFVTLNESGRTVYNKFRAFIEWPGVYTTVKHIEQYLGKTTTIKPKSTVIKLKGVSLGVEDKLHIEYVQLPNKGVIKFADFKNGYIKK